MSSAPAITWLFVITIPFSLIINPDPKPDYCLSVCLSLSKSLDISPKGDPGGNSNGNCLPLVLTVCVVEIYTTDGINSSAKSANDSGTATAFEMKLNLKKIKINNIFWKKRIYFFIYQIIRKPIAKNITPKVLNLFSGVFLINSSILLILDGKMVINKPSIKKINPIAIIRSFTIKINYLFLIVGPVDFPKNLKNSLSGDKTKEVSPPIKAFS